MLGMAFYSGRPWAFVEGHRASSHRKVPGGPRCKQIYAVIDFILN